MTRRSLLAVAGVEAVAGTLVAYALLVLAGTAWRLGTSHLLMQLPVLAGLGLVVGASAKLCTRWRSAVDLAHGWHRSARERIEARWPSG